MPTLNLNRLPMVFAASMATLLLAFCFGLVLDQLRSATAVPLPTDRAVIPDRRLEGERAVEVAQKRISSAPEDPGSMTALANAYMLRVRETGDPAYYSRVDALLQKVLGAYPDDVEAVIAAGSLALSRHDFSAALGLGEKAVRLSPYRARAYGVLTDALIELGRYGEAINVAQQMVDLRPDLASYARVSYLRELHGDLSGATEAMRWVVQSGNAASEATAWTEVQLGNLLFAQGDLDGAARVYESSTRRIDGYVHGLAGLARVTAARGDLAGAAALYERAAEALPLPELVIGLGDTYARLGDFDRANQQYQLVTAMKRLLAANGVRSDADLALFQADHRLNLASTLEAARSEYALRPSVQVADTLAWVEYQHGEIAAALVHSREALRLGTRDPFMLYRAGVIAQESGDMARAYELLKSSSDLNPSFSIEWADDLRARLERLSALRGGR